MDMQGIMGLLTGQYARDYDAVMAKNAQWEKEQAAKRSFDAREERIKRIFGNPQGQPLTAGGQDVGGNTVDGAFSQINPDTLEPLPASGLYSDDPLQKELARTQLAGLDSKAFQPAYTATVTAPLDQAKAVAVQESENEGKKVTELAKLNFFKANPKAKSITVENVDGSKDTHLVSEYYDQEGTNEFSGETELTDERQAQLVEQKKQSSPNAKYKQMYDPVLHKFVDHEVGTEVGNLVPIDHALTPKEVAETKEKREKKLGNLIQSRDRFKFAASIATKAKEAIGFLSTGVPGQLSAWISSSPAGTLRSLILPLKSREGIGELMAMKESSANGSSGFGSLQKAELDLLVSKTVALDEAMDDDVLRENLQTIFELYTKLDKSMTADITAMQKADSEGNTDNNSNVVDFNDL